MLEIRTDNKTIEQKFQQAIKELNHNVKKVYGYDKPVLNEGGIYAGIWHECGPLEGLVYAPIDPEVAKYSHEIFFDLQDEDGYIPAYITGDIIGRTQTQIVVPIAKNAYELYLLNNDKPFLEKAYHACVKFDAWISKYRDSKKIGVMELFTEFDTGHDNSGRFINIPKLMDDPITCPNNPELPYIAPDLTATRYGSRVALSKIAKELGLNEDVVYWENKAIETKNALMEYCYDSKTNMFYDRKSNNEFNYIISDVITRVASEHVLDQELFDSIFEEYIYNPKHFWAEYPLSSISLSDPKIDIKFPENSWGGASQALTALRTSRWFDYYGKEKEHRELMKKWIYAINNAKEFMQQIHPYTGEFSTSITYSPCSLVYIDFISRLYGITFDGKKITYNAYLPENTEYIEYKYEAFGIVAELEVNKDGYIAKLNGKILKENTLLETISFTL